MYAKYCRWLGHMHGPEHHQHVISCQAPCATFRWSVNRPWEATDTLPLVYYNCEEKSYLQVDWILNMKPPVPHRTRYHGPYYM